MAQKKRLNVLMQALGQDFDKDPVRFFKTVIMPLLPRDAKLTVEHDGIVIWRNLLGQEVKAEDVGQKSVDGGRAVKLLGGGADGAQ
jgi:hypothetical protein